MRGRIRSAVALAIALLGCIAIPQAASATPSWKLVFAPHELTEKAPRPEAFLRQVSCWSSTACMSVGQYNVGSADSHHAVPLAELWSGGEEMTVKTTLVPTGAKESYLRGVSCTSSTACIAVGGYVNSGGTLVALAEVWEGTKWAIETLPIPTGAKASVLNGVSCVPPEVTKVECYFTGDYTNSEGVQVPLTERDGKGIKIESAPSPTGAKESALTSVSCTSGKECTTVGYYETSTKVKETLAERWNGTEWKIQTTPTKTKQQFTGVSCASATFCAAVGTLRESWNGTEWKVTSEVGGLASVSCVSSTACEGVGTRLGKKGSFETPVTLAERWNGTEWSRQETPNEEGAFHFSFADELLGVSCTSTTTCLATGSAEFNEAAPRWEAIAEKYA